MYTMVGFLFLIVSIPSAILIRRLERRYAAV
jgi:polar amino acid transport system permease protein